jgi:hypothetical protein
MKNQVWTRRPDGVVHHARANGEADTELFDGKPTELVS